jgi:hypothetical protein
MGLRRRSHVRSFLGALALAGAGILGAAATVLAGSGPGPFPH